MLNCSLEKLCHLYFTQVRQDPAAWAFSSSYFIVVNSFESRSTGWAITDILSSQLIYFCFSYSVKPFCRFSAIPTTNYVFSSHTSWHRQNIGFPAISWEALRTAALRSPRSPKMPKTWPSWLLLGSVSDSNRSQKKEEKQLSKELEERLLGPKHEISQDQWHPGGHEVCVFPQGRGRHH